VFKCAERLNEEKEKATEANQWLGMVEARAGVEPTYRYLQTRSATVQQQLATAYAYSDSFADCLK
jgi:hypothetical protein